MRNVQAELMVATVVLDNCTSELKQALLRDLQDELQKTDDGLELEACAKSQLYRIKTALISYEDALIQYRRAKRLVTPDTEQGQVHWLQLNQAPRKKDQRAA